MCVCLPLQVAAVPAAAGPARWVGRLSAAAHPALGFPAGSEGKASARKAGDQVRPLGREYPLEKGMATHSSTFALRIPWVEEPGGLQAMGLQRVGHD